MTSIDLCVDTQILVKASLDDKCAHYQLLAEIEACNTFAIAVEPTIVQEYNDKMRWDRFGQVWIRKMASNGRTVRRDKRKLPKNIRIELLDDLHFDPTDIKFVEVSLATNSKHLAAEDDDYSTAVKKLLRRKCDLHISNCGECQNFVRTAAASTVSSTPSKD